VENEENPRECDVPGFPFRDWKSSRRYNIAVSFIVRDFWPEDFEMLWRMDQECFPPGIAYSRQELKIYLGHRGSLAQVATDGR
jgi:hypothetical protein